MQKINFQNLPSTTTPINATNLNAIQTNVENVFNGSEAMGNVVVGSIRTKNMFNNNSFLNANGGVGSYLPLDTGIRAITGGTGANQWLNFKLPNSLLGKTCTLSFKATPSSSNTPMVRIYYGNATNMTNTNANFDLYGSGNKSITNTFLSSFPSGTDTIYMLVYCNRDGSGFSSGAYIDYTNFQLEEGSTATTYTPYQPIGTNTDSGWISLNSYIKYRKVNDIVYLVCDNNGFVNIPADSSYHAIGTLPTNYRPSIVIPFASHVYSVATKSIIGRVETNGNISIYTNAAIDYFGFSIAFPV